MSKVTFREFVTEGVVQKWNVSVHRHDTRHATKFTREIWSPTRLLPRGLVFWQGGLYSGNQVFGHDKSTARGRLPSSQQHFYLKQ